MNQLKLIQSYPEVENIRTFVFEKGDRSWLAGQYQHYYLPQAGKTEAENSRFFTIAAAPSENEIHISTRVSDSTFKRALAALRPGDTIEVISEVEGDFTWEDDVEAILVAGGIGITPYRSMLLERDARGKKIPAVLLYFSRSDQFAFRKEFDDIAVRHPELTIKYLAGQAITAETILKEVPQGTSMPLYLSGPEPMVDAIGDDLKKRGVTDLRQDWFPGYTETTY